MKKFTGIASKAYLPAYFAAVTAIQIVFACILQYEPKYDVKSVFDGAAALAETGKLTGELIRYFAWASNNFGFTFIMSVMIKIFGAVTKNYFLIFAFTNIVFINLGVYFLHDLICRVCGKKTAGAALAALFFYIPMYFFPSMIYTDTATMFIPVVCLNLFTRLQTGQTQISKKKSAAYYALMGGSGGVGFVIKPTAAIMFIAILIVCCVFIRKAEVYKSIALSAALFFAVILIFQIPYNIHVPKDVREKNALPYLHWVKMGLQNGGKGTWSEFAETMSYPTYAEKSAHAVNTIKARLRGMGVFGFAELLIQKFGVLYSSPDLQPCGIIYFDQNETTQKFGAVRFGNAFYIIYNHIVFYGACALAFAGVFFRSRNFTAYLALFGLHLFFAFWEVNPRWLTNYFFVFLFLACVTVKSVIEKITIYKLRRNVFNEKNT